MLAWQRKTQHPFACSGSGEPSSWTWETLWCYLWNLVCRSPWHLVCGRNEWTPTQHGLHSSPGKFLQPITHPRWPQVLGLQRTGSTLREYLCISIMLPSITLTDSAVAPASSQHLHTDPGASSSLPWEAWGSPHVWRPSAVPRSRSSHVARNKAGASCPSVMRD